MINLDIAKLAFEKVTGEAFEKFAQATFADLAGADFIPLGGHKDWGADGFLSTVHSTKKPHYFYQFSIEAGTETKIRKTIARLREVGRDVRHLTYATSIVVPRLDNLENDLGEELKIVLRIKDQSYFVGQVNSSPSIISAFQTYMAPFVAYLNDLGHSALIADPPDSVNPAVYVFLRNELENNSIGGPADGIAEAFIIWALRNTGATEGEFLTRDQILGKVEEEVPGLSKVIEPYIDSRLKALRDISNSQNPPIRYHAKPDRYCIAFNIRKKMRDENLQAETLKHNVLEEYLRRIARLPNPLKDEDAKKVAELCLRSIEKCLEQEGIEFAAFMRGEAAKPSTIQRTIEDCAYEDGVKRGQIGPYSKVVAFVLEQAFINPTKDEQLLYSRIASVYTILFCLRTEPKLIGYFQGVAGKLRLLVGSDIILEAITERFLPRDAQIFSNTLKLVLACGGSLVLTEAVLQEVQTHINASDKEFQNHYAEGINAITPELIDEIDRPLIRSFFRGKLSDDPNRPRNWPQFLNNFCDPRFVNSKTSKEDIRKYLMREWHMSYESKQDIENECDLKSVRSLAKSLEAVKSEKQLAYNDSLMVHLVYSRRRKGKERDDTSSYGLKTWWLTKERKITEFTRVKISELGPYLMPPEYLLNYLTLLPKKEQIRGISKRLFPSLLGVHLASSHSQQHVERLHNYLKEFKSVDDARKGVLIAKFCDDVKAGKGAPSWFEIRSESE